MGTDASGQKISIKMGIKSTKIETNASVQIATKLKKKKSVPRWISRVDKTNS